MTGVRVRDRFHPPPSKGTKSRAILLMMLRGATAREIVEAGLVNRETNVSAAIPYLMDQCSYDVRSIKIRRGQATIYKVVGKMRWDGSYRSFVDPRKYIAELEVSTP